MKPLDILILEDTPDDVELVLIALRRDQLNFTWRHVDNAEAFKAALQQPPDVILADFHLPQWSGLDALKLLREHNLSIPLLIISGTVSDQEAVIAMREGAADYLLKDRTARLGSAVRGAVERKRLAQVTRAAVGERRRSEQRFLSLVNTIDGIVFEADAESFQFTFVNNRAEALLGYPAQQWLDEMNFWINHVHPEDREEASEYCRRCTAQNLAHDFEYRMIAADGRVVWLRDIVTVVEAESGRKYLRGIMIDVTQPRAQAERIARLSRIHEVMSNTSSAVMRIRDRDRLLAEACRIAVEHGGFEIAWVGLHQPENSQVKLVAQAGQVLDYMGPGYFSTREGDPYCCLLTTAAVETRSPVVCHDIATDPRMAPWKEEPLSRGLCSIGLLPLVVDGRPIGVMTLYATDANFFTPDEMNLLRQLAGDISFGLQYIEKEEQARYLALYDSLTDLPNSTSFAGHLKQAVRTAGSDGGFAVIMVDVDRFKSINDSHGRQTGDRLIQQVARRLERYAPQGGLARLGAIRFGLLVPDVHNADDVARFVERTVLPHLAEPFQVKDIELRISARAGLAMYPQDGTDAESLFTKAEAALKNAKTSGESYLFFARSMTDSVAEKLRLENELRAALERKEFVLHYQPEIQLATGEVSAIEALIRWQSPSHGLVPPGKFIPLLEETGLIMDVGEWAVGQAVRDSQGWQRNGLRVPRIAVNISARQFRQQDFATRIRDAIGRDGSVTIDLEITESTIMEGIEAHLADLTSLSNSGIGIVVDDFGTGYSSLAYIARLPIRALKIDRSFVVGMVGSESGRIIVSTIIQLAHSLKLTVVAEGVETEEQLGILRELDCDEVQGYLFSRPLPPPTLEQFLRDRVAPVRPIRSPRRRRKA